MMVKGYKKPIEEEDLYELNQGDKAGVWVPNFEAAWKHETEKLLRLVLLTHSQCEDTSTKTYSSPE